MLVTDLLQGPCRRSAEAGAGAAGGAGVGTSKLQCHSERCGLPQRAHSWASSAEARLQGRRVSHAV